MKKWRKNVFNQRKSWRICLCYIHECSFTFIFWYWSWIVQLLCVPRSYKWPFLCFWRFKISFFFDQFNSLPSTSLSPADFICKLTSQREVDMFDKKKHGNNIFSMNVFFFFFLILRKTGSNNQIKNVYTVHNFIWKFKPSWIRVLRIPCVLCVLMVVCFWWN